MKRALGTVFALTILFLPADAESASPLVVDDARLLDPKTCQVEAWAQRNRDSTELWMLPACNPFGAFDLTIGGARTRESGAAELTDAQVQVKTLFRVLEPGSWGVGLAAGTVRRPHRDTANGWPGDTYVNVPLSFAAQSEAWALHVNAGALRRRDENRTSATWGLGGEARLRSDLTALGEVYSIDRGRPFYQAGLRYTVIKDRWQMDATYGNRAVSDTQQRWFTIGMRLLSPPFLP